MKDGEEPMTAFHKMAIRMTSCAVLALCSLQCLVCTAGEPAKGLKHSDVAFMDPAPREIYEIYGATLISWGGRALRDQPQDIEIFRGRVRVAHDLGMKYSAGAAFRTAFAEMIDFDPHWRDSLCLNIEGQPITIPWLWDQKHDGYPAYWFCTNALGYQAFLKWQVKMAMTAKVDGLHIDDYGGTAGTESLGGCFCRYCRAAFTEYLKKNVSTERLKECEITSLDGFDYREFLKSKGITTTKAFRGILNSPAHLGPEYLRFQYSTSAAFVGEMRQYAERLAGHPLLVSVNDSASDPKSLLVAPYLSYFCGEVSHGTQSFPWGPQANRDLEPVWTFKLADAVGRFEACTGTGGDWAYIDAHKKPGLVRQWIAQDYAFGHCLMVPHRQWAYTKETGTHWYQSRPEDYAYLYRFVGRYSDLFDGYEAVAPVALLYSNAAARRNIAPVRDACLWLARNSIPFEVVVAGDDWLHAKLTPEVVSKYRAVIVAEPTLLDGEQKRTIDALAAAAKVIRWDATKGIDEATLNRLLPRPITFEDGPNVIAVARAIPGDPKAPAIVQLLNRNYEQSQDATTALKNVKVTLRKDLFRGRSFGKSVFYGPPPSLDRQHSGKCQPLTLPIASTDNGIVIAIPELDGWGIIQLVDEAQRK